MFTLEIQAQGAIKTLSMYIIYAYSTYTVCKVQQRTRQCERIMQWAVTGGAAFNAFIPPLDLYTYTGMLIDRYAMPISDIKSLSDFYDCLSKCVNPVSTFYFMYCFHLASLTLKKYSSPQILMQPSLFVLSRSVSQGSL